MPLWGEEGIHIISHANEVGVYRICAANISHGASRISQKGNVGNRREPCRKNSLSGRDQSKIPSQANRDLPRQRNQVINYELKRKGKTPMKKKLSVFILLFAMLSMFICGCSPKTEKVKDYIGIVSAMDNEIDLLLKEAVIDRVDTIADVEYHIGSLHGQPVIITRSGIGKVRAASGVTAMLTEYPVSKVIFTGIAGGVADETQVLDEVIATRLVEHDYGILSNDGFEWRSGDPGYGG